MNKTLITVCSIIICSFCCTTCALQNDYMKSDLDKWEVAGPVKWVEELTYFPKQENSRVDTSDINLEENFSYLGKQELSFNEKGILIDHKFYQPKYISWHFIYDDQGMNKDGTYFNPKGDISRFSNISKNEQGNPTTHILYNIDSTVYTKQTWTYNDLQQVIEEENEAGRRSRFTFKYDGAGREIERKTYMKEKYESKRVQTYNRNGKRSAIKVYDEDGTKLWIEEFEYNDKLTKKTYTHFAKDSKVISNHNLQGHPYRLKSLKLSDESKVLIEQELHYKYDEKGNWLRRILYEDGKLKSLHTRMVKYF